MFTKLKKKLNVEVANPSEVVGDRTAKVHGPGLASPGPWTRKCKIKNAYFSPTDLSVVFNRGDMFTKLKKKLNVEVANPSEVVGDRTAKVHGPGLASPVAAEWQGSDKEASPLGDTTDSAIDSAIDSSPTPSQHGRENGKSAKQNEELDQSMAELLDMTEQMEIKEVKVKRLEGEVISLLERITQMSVTSELLEDENRDKSRKIEEQETAQEVLRKTVQRTEERLAKLTTLLSEKESHSSRLEERIRTLEQRLSEGNQPGDDRVASLTTQKLELEAEVDHQRRICEETEEWLKEKVATLESQNALLQKEKEAGKVAAQAQIRSLEHKQEECLEKEIDTERKLTILEEEIDQLKIDKKRLEEEKGRLTEKMKLSQEREDRLTQQEELLTVELARARDVESSHKSVHTELRQCAQDKDTLLLRNAQLFQEVESAKRVQAEVCTEMVHDGQQKDTVITQLEQRLQELQRDVDTHQTKVTQLENQRHTAQGDLQCAELEKLQTSMRGLEDQLLEKNKTIKQQQQRLNDLKKLLQRELKVQTTIPSDSQPSVTGAVTHSHTRSKDILPAVHAFTPQFDARNPHQVTPSQPRTSNSVPVAQLPNCSQNNAAFTPTLITTSSSSLVTSKNSQSCDSCQRPYCVELDEGNYITDTNFRYLRHVVLKFMLSAETEALQLIKAVAMLLHFTVAEQKLLHETLEWRMSWFGPRPKVGKGSSAKAVPPLF